MMRLHRFGNIIAVFLLAFSISWLAHAQVDFGNARLNKIYKKLKTLQKNKNPRDRILMVGKTAYYIDKDGALVSAPLDWALQDLASGHKTESADGKPDQSQSDENQQDRIARHLKRNPGKAYIDEKSGTAYWLEPDGSVSSAPVDLYREAFPGAQIGNVPIPSPIPPPQTHPRDMVCKDDQGKVLTAKNHLIKSSAQLSFPGGNCNSYRVAGDLVMTNAHCMEWLVKKSDKRACLKFAANYKRVKIKGGYTEEYEPTPQYRACKDNLLAKFKNKSLLNAKGDEDDDTRGVTARFVVDGKPQDVKCQQMVAVKDSVDYALLKCSGIPSSVPVAKVSTEPLQQGRPLQLVTWDFKGDNVRARTQNGRVLSRGDQDSNDKMHHSSQIVIPGNSGSVMYNEKMEAVGLVNSSNWGAVSGVRETTGFYSLGDVMADVAKQAPQAHQQIRQSAEQIKIQCSASSSAAVDLPDALDSAQ